MVIMYVQNLINRFHIIFLILPKKLFYGFKGNSICNR